MSPPTESVAVTDHADPAAPTDTDAFRAAVDAVADAGGGTVTVPPGEYETGTVRLRDRVTLRLEAGATVYAARDPAEYTDDRPGPEGEPPFLLAEDCSDVAVVGRGCIDGRSADFLDMDDPIRGHSAESDAHPLVSNGPHRARQGDDYLDRSGGTDGWPVAKGGFRPGPMLLFDGCENVLVEDVTLRDMPAWTVALDDCDGAAVRGVTVDNHMRVPNCDGVSVMNSEDVRIADCRIYSCDDSVTVGARAGVDRPTRGVVVTNCVLSSSACAVKVGSETAGDVSDLLVSNCVVRSSNRGLGIQHRDEGSVENVRFSGITVETSLRPGPWWGKAEPVYVTSVPRDEGTDLGSVSGVHFSDVVADAENGGVVYAHETADVRDVRLDGVRLRVGSSPHADAVGGNFDLQPTSVVPPVWERDIPALHCENASDVALRDVTVEWGDAPEPYYAEGLRCVGVDGLTVDGFDGRGAHARACADGAGGEPDAAIAVRETTGATVRNGRARPGTGAFLAVSDTDDDRLFANNDLAEAASGIEGEHGFTTGGNLPPRGSTEGE